jgi:PAS domain S-box-containing protein
MGAEAGMISPDARPDPGAVEDREHEPVFPGHGEMIQALEESEFKYRRLFNNIRDAILVANQRREIVDCNEAFLDLFGYRLEEIVGKQTVLVYQNEQEFRELGRALRENVSREQFFHTVQYRKKNGEVFPGETNVFYHKNAAGEVTGFIGLIRDVTQQLSTRDKLRRERDLFDRIMETSPVGIAVFDSGGWVQYLNRRGQEILGLEAGTFSENCCWLEDHPAWREIVHYVQGTDQVIRQRRMAIKQGENSRVIAVNAAPLNPSAGFDPGIVTAFEDVTEQVERERKVQSRLTREIQILEKLVAAKANPDPIQDLGGQSLEESLPETFGEFLEEYACLLDLALEEKVYQVDHHLTPRLKSLAGRLGALRSVPRDLVSLHTHALQSKEGQVTAPRLSEYSQEGRLLLLELMGYLAVYYRSQFQDA